MTSFVYIPIILKLSRDTCSDLARTNMLYFTTTDPPLSSRKAPSKAEHSVLNDNLSLARYSCASHDQHMYTSA